MKRILSLLLMVALLIGCMMGLVSCSEGENGLSDDEEEENEGSSATVVMKSEHYEITDRMLQYFYHDSYQETYQNYYNMAVTYTGNAVYISYFGWNVDENHPLDDEQHNLCKLGRVQKDENGNECKDENGNKVYESVAIQIRKGNYYTWWDYFMDQALQRGKDTLLFCEAAYAAGYTSLSNLNAERETEIKAELKNLKSISKLYGKEVSREDIRLAMTLEALAEAYSTLLQTNLENAITDDEIQACYEQNPALYDEMVVLKIHTERTYKEFLYDEEDMGFEEAKEKYLENFEKVGYHYHTLIQFLAKTYRDRASFRDWAYSIYLYDLMDRLVDREDYKVWNRDEIKEIALQLAKDMVNGVIPHECASDAPIEVQVAFDLAEQIFDLEMIYPFADDDGETLWELFSQKEVGTVIVVEENMETVKYYINSTTPARTEEQTDSDVYEGEFLFDAYYLLAPPHKIDTWYENIRSELLKERFDQQRDTFAKKYASDLQLEEEKIAKIS